MKVLVIGASENHARYSNKAIQALRSHQHEVKAIGLRSGKVLDVPFDDVRVDFQDVDTVTLYVGKANQTDYIDYIIDTIQPRRVIFNPGTENFEFQEKLVSKGIIAEVACTLVLLSTAQF
jgi:predicted CoA-binding protein